jgi:hypothetical protein
MNLRQPRIRVVLFSMVSLCLIAATHPGQVLRAQTTDVASLTKQAKDGNAESQYQLADAYLNGKGVNKDSRQGVEWLKKAAALDHPGAQLVLSYMYLKGGEQNIPKDPAQGLRWLQKSADHGYAPAEYSLALLYRDGDADTGIARNPGQAATLFRKAARQPGSIRSQAALQEMLQKKLISEQEANWRAPEPARAPEPVKVAQKGKAPPFTLVEVEAGLKGYITNKRMATLVQKYGVDFKLNSTTRKRLADDGAQDDLLAAISASNRS